MRTLYIVDPKITHDTRETYQPAPVVLPTRTMVKVSDRMRLIRQGDNRELATLEAALKKGKGVRPWRLSTDKSNLFHAARLMREEEERQKQKIMYAAGMYIDDQAPITGTTTDGSSSSSSSGNKGKGNPAGGGSGSVAEGGPTGSATMDPDGEEGAADKCGVVNHDGGGASADGRASDSPPDATAAKSSRENKGGGVGHGGDGGEGGAGGGWGGGGGGNGSYSGEQFGLDIENDVRKRVLDLVGARALDRLQSTFHTSNGWLGRDDFIEALLCAVIADNGDGGDGDTETGTPHNSSSSPERQRDDSTMITSISSTVNLAGAGDGGGNSSPPTSRATAAPPPEGVRKGPSAGDACAGTTDGGGCNRTVESGTDASAEGVQGSGRIMATPSAHQHPRHNNHDSHSQPKEKSTIFAGSFSSSVSSCAGGAVGGGSASAAHETPKRAASAPKQLVCLYDRLFDFVSLQHGDWTTWDEVSTFLLFDGETQGGQGGPRQYMPAGSVHLPKILGLESAIVFKVSRPGQALDAAALLIRNSASFLVASLDDLTSSTNVAPVQVQGHVGQVLAVVFVPGFNVLVTSDEKGRTVRCWDVFLKPGLDVVATKRQAKASEPQVMLKWLHPPAGAPHPTCGGRSGGGGGDGEESNVLENSDVLLSGGAGGTVNIWQLTTKHLVILQSLPGHTGAVTSACILPQPEVIVTGALDADLRVWATKTYKFKRVMKGHSRGVVTVEYSPSQRIIVSAGFDHDVLVWSSVGGQVICRLSGHVCSLMAVRVSTFSSDVISMSMDGIIKVWDSANFKCVQTIHANRLQDNRTAPLGRGKRGAGGNGGGGNGGEHGGGGAGQGGQNRDKSKAFSSFSSSSSSSSSSQAASRFADLFLFEGETSRLLVCRGTELDFYDNGRAGEKEVTDNDQTIDVMYHPQTGTFASVASTRVKLWDARTGRLTRAYGVPPRPAKLSMDHRWTKRPRRAGEPVEGRGRGRRRAFSRVLVGGGGVLVGGGGVLVGGGGVLVGGGGGQVASAQAEEITSPPLSSFPQPRLRQEVHAATILARKLASHKPPPISAASARHSHRLSSSARPPSDAPASVSACIDARGHQIVMGLSTGRVACVRFLTGSFVGQLDRLAGEVTDVAGFWNGGSGGLILSASDGTALLQKMAVDVAEPRRTIAVLNPHLEAIRMETSNQVVEGTVADAGGALKRLMVGAKVLRAKKTFLTTLEAFRAAGRTGGKPSSSSSASSGFLPVTATAGGRDVAKTTEKGSKAEAVAQRSPPKAGLFRTTAEETARPEKENSGGGGSDGPGRAGGGTERSVQFAAGAKGLAAAGTGAVGKDEELRSARPVETAGRERVPTPPPPGQKPRRPSSSSSLFNEKFAKRFLRSTGGGAGRGGQGKIDCGRIWGREHGGGDSTATGTATGTYRDGREGEGGGKAGARPGGGGGGGGAKGSATSENSGSQCRSHITSVAVSHMHQLVATGALNGSVIVWDVRKGPSTHGLAALEAHNGYQVNGICFLEPHAALATCNLEGRVAVWRMGPAVDPLEDYRGWDHDDGGSAELRAKGNGGGYEEAAAIRRAENRRRERSGGGMPPSSEWRCVALFFNNTTAPTHAAAAAATAAYTDDPSADGLLQAGGGAEAPPQGIPVPAAVNSLAWSSLKERLFTADTVGFVKVWDVTGALTWAGDDADERNTDSASNTASISTSSGADSTNGCTNGTIANKQADDLAISATTTTTTTATTNNNSSNSSNINGNTSNTTATAEGDFFRKAPSADVCLQGPPSTPIHGADHDGDGVTAASSEKGDSSAKTSMGELDGGTGGALAGEKYRPPVCSEARRDRGQVPSTSERGYSTLWPSEPSESISGEDYGDRFGRGLGLRFIRRLGEWRPGQEGRQEVIKVKVFEGQNVMFRGVVVDRHRYHRNMREGSPGGDAAGGGRLVKKTTSGTVMVVTITPDKLVRFWTSSGDAIGCLDQEYVASPQQKIAARPLASWRICLVASDGVSKVSTGGAGSSRKSSPPVGARISANTSTTAESATRKALSDEASSSGCSGESSTL